LYYDPIQLKKPKKIQKLDQTLFIIKIMQIKEYKVVIYQEGLLGSLLLGASKVDPIKFSEFLNLNARQGWRVVTMEKDIRRMLLFWQRESYLVIMEREA
jgi:hypothetical protein